MLVKTFALLALAAGVIASGAAPPQPRTNAEALARGMPPLDPRHGGGHGWHKPPKPSNKPVPTQAGPDPDFSKTCSWYDIDFTLRNRPTLRAKCKNNRGKNVYSSINLNKCLTNVNGKLKCAPGGFTGVSRNRRSELDERHGGPSGGRKGWSWGKKKCTGCEHTGDDTIECSCPVNGNSGDRVDATYALGDCISNTNGKLTCKKID